MSKKHSPLKITLSFIFVFAFVGFCLTHVSRAEMTNDNQEENTIEASEVPSGEEDTSLTAVENLEDKNKQTELETIKEVDGLPLSLNKGNKTGSCALVIGADATPSYWLIASILGLFLFRVKALRDVEV